MIIRIYKFFPVPLFYQPTHQFIATPCLPLYCRINHDLNIVEIKRGIGSYLGCYLKLADVDQCCILLVEPMSCYLIKREEELIHLLVVGLEHFAILLQQAVECRLDDAVLFEVGSVGTEASFFHV
jgi:hypothetical protein